MRDGPGGWRGFLGARMLDLVMLVLLGAGVLKLIDVSAFAMDLLTWELIPDWAAAPLAYAVPFAEVSLAGLWFLRVWRRWAVVLAGVLLVVFTVGFVGHLVFAEAPTCGCLGKVLQFEDHAHAAWFAIGRNAVMLLVYALGLSLAWQRIGPGAARGSRTAEMGGTRVSGFHPGGASGFTIVETMLVVALVGVLLSLSLPALGQARDRARRLVSMGNLRTHGGAVAAYTGDSNGSFPYLTVPDATYTVFRHSGLAIETPYFGLYNTWNWGLADGYYGGQLRHGSMFTPWEEPTVFAGYWYSASLIAHPGFWDPETRRGPEQWRGTNSAGGTFASAKGVFVEGGSLFGGDVGDRVYRVSMVDGSAVEVAEREAGAVYPNGEGEWVGSFFPHGLRFLHTVDGVRGRDVR